MVHLHCKSVLDKPNRLQQHEQRAGKAAAAHAARRMRDSWPGVSRECHGQDKRLTVTQLSQEQPYSRDSHVTVT